MISMTSKLKSFSFLNGLLFLAVAAGLSTAATQPAKAASREDVILDYAVYVHGFKVFSLGFNVSLSPDSYSSQLYLKPQKMINLLADLTIQFGVRGQINSQKVTPVSFNAYNKLGWNKKTIKVTWNADARPSVERSFKVTGEKLASLQKTVKPGILDPISGFLQMSLSDSQNPCSRTYLAYNGEKVHRMGFTYLGQAPAGKNAGASLSGPTIKCRITRTPVAGYSARDLARYSKKPQVFYAWFAQYHSKAANKTVLIPVALSGRAKGQNFTAIVKRSTINGAPM